ncbi:MAG: nucleotidyl transferase AbiEii/AbiGii toxin family protein [Bacteroidetes bacterium]|nr:nucleotidyl transferase AbiEii/AbiGii toxin family protein [Bacteroidota bacterium]
MNDLLKKIMPSPLPETPGEMLIALREVLQSLALLGLWRAKFFNHTAFYGGTALRILYGLDRLLNEAINNLDINAARKEVAPFIKDARKLDIWSKDFFRSAAQMIVVI